MSQRANQFEEMFDNIFSDFASSFKMGINQSIGVVLTTTDATIPTYATDGDTCADLYASESRVIPAGKVQVVNTGLVFNTPKGIGGFIRERSSMAVKGIFTRAGVLDSGYRGIVGIVLHNSTDEDFLITKGDRIAQIEFREVTQMKFVRQDKASETARGEGGFGSTGR